MIHCHWCESAHFLLAGPKDNLCPACGDPVAPAPFHRVPIGADFLDVNGETFAKTSYTTGEIDGEVLRFPPNATVYPL